MTREHLLTKFDYDRLTGTLKYKGRVRRVNGQPVKRRSVGGYLVTTFDGVTMYVHQIVWLLEGNEIKDGEVIDHINRDKTDNRIQNLRQVSRQENNINIAPRRNNKSGYKGVDWYKPYGKWRSRIKIYGKETSLGYFDSLDDAIAARKLAEKNLFPNLLW